MLAVCISAGDVPLHHNLLLQIDAQNKETDVVEGRREAGNGGKSRHCTPQVDFGAYRGGLSRPTPKQAVTLVCTKCSLLGLFTAVIWLRIDVDDMYDTSTVQ